jgi:dTDP-4-dehydrorhamnose reductase
VVADQIGRPTPAADLASAIAAAGVRVLRSRSGSMFGTYHFAGAGVTSWHGFAEAIVAAQAGITGRQPTVRAITSDEYPTPARRPSYSVLDCTRIERAFGLGQRPWRAGLQEVIAYLLGGTNVDLPNRQCPKPEGRFPDKQQT